MCPVLKEGYCKCMVLPSLVDGCRACVDPTALFCNYLVLSAMPLFSSRRRHGQNLARQLTTCMIYLFLQRRHVD